MSTLVNPTSRTALLDFKLLKIVLVRGILNIRGEVECFLSRLIGASVFIKFGDILIV